MGHSSTVSELVRSRRGVHNTVRSSRIAGGEDHVLGLQGKLVERQARAGREAELLLVVEHVRVVSAALGADDGAFHGVVGAFAVGLLHGELGVGDTLGEFRLDIVGQGSGMAMLPLWGGLPPQVVALWRFSREKMSSAGTGLAETRPKRASGRRVVNFILRLMRRLLGKADDRVKASGWPFN